jgi:NH3-dependent NAD+ synthetase
VTEPQNSLLTNNLLLRLKKKPSAPLEPEKIKQENKQTPKMGKKIQDNSLKKPIQNSIRKIKKSNFTKLEDKLKKFFGAYDSDSN